MYCTNCGKEIDDHADVCPYCGTQTNEQPADQYAAGRQQSYTQQNYVGQPNNTLAIVGFVFAFIMPLIGLIVSIMAKKKNDEMDSTGRGLATAGLIISIIAMVLYFILLIIYVSALAALLA